MDDSANARAALRWALDHSTEQDEVVAVHAWHLPMLVGSDLPIFDPDLFRGSAESTLRDLLDEVTESAQERNRITPLLAMGTGAQILLEEGERADLIVMGARGHGGFAGLLLGSVATTVVNHAPCPTVVVPMREASDVKAGS
jgi:nucleotide-binding universal stress UspA family protein